MKYFTQKISLIKTFGVFFLLFVLQSFSVQIRPYILPNVALISNPFPFQIGYEAFLLIGFAAFAEELIFRFMLTKKGFFHGMWILLLCIFVYLNYFIFPNKESLPNFFVPTIGIFVLVILIFSKFKAFTEIYLKYLYNPSLFSISFSSLVFIAVHLPNFINWQSNLVSLSLFLLLIHLPSTLFYCWVRISRRYGFWWSTFYHGLNNLFVLVLTILFP
jgi:hypothetical protein